MRNLCKSVIVLLRRVRKNRLGVIYVYEITHRNTHTHNEVIHVSSNCLFNSLATKQGYRYLISVCSKIFGLYEIGIRRIVTVTLNGFVENKSHTKKLFLKNKIIVVGMSSRVYRVVSLSGD